MPTLEEKLKIEPNLLRALEHYEVRRKHGWSNQEARLPYFGDSLVVPIQDGRALVLIRSASSSEDVGNLLRFYSQTVYRVVNTGAKTWTVAIAAPRLVWHLAILNDVDSIYSTVIDRLTGATVIDRREEVSATFFFPLAIGDQWYYRDVEKDSRTRRSALHSDLDYDTHSQIISSENIYGHVFYLMISTNYASDGNVRRVDSMYYAASESKILMLPPSRFADSSSIRTWADLSYPLGAGRIIREGTSVFVEKITAKNDSLITIERSTPHHLDSGSEKTFKRGVGLYESHGYMAAISHQLVRWEIH